MNVTLTEHQEDIISSVILSMLAGNKRIVLKGSAGVGKTTACDALITAFKREMYTYGPVYVTAPTHKALSILEGKIDTTDREYIEFSTVHSGLKLKRKLNDDTGEYEFYQSPYVWYDAYPPFPKASLIIVDESSMISTMLLNYLNHEKMQKIPIIFIGDDKQLNPVDEEESPIFTQGYPTFELTEIIRQGEGNPIISLSRNLPDIWSKHNNMTSEKLGYIFDNNFNYIMDRLAEANGTDEIKYLAWTNDEINKVNSMVRHKIYGDNPAKIELGETIVFKEPFMDYHTNFELKVETLDIITKQIVVPTENTHFTKVGREYAVSTILGSYDTVEMKMYVINGRVPVVHEESELLFARKGRGLKLKAVNKDITWQTYHWYFEQFAKFTYNHAITVHKSQGSTYQRAVINIKNISRNRSVAEKQRLFYTAITRAAKTVVLYNV